MNLHEQSAQGTAAEQALDALGSAFEAVKISYLKAWTESDPEDTAKRERMFLCVGMLGDVEAALRSTVDSGKMARREIENIEADEKTPNITPGVV